MGNDLIKTKYNTSPYDDDWREIASAPRDGLKLVVEFLWAMSHPDLDPPQAFAEDDGMLGFDWDLERRRTLSVHFYDDGTIGWSALIGERSGHGKFKGAWSDEFRSFAEALRLPLPAPPKETT